jgi:uncharacterized protein YndB with AHSA1/START domain
MKTFTVDLTRTIPADPAAVFAGWLDPACPGTPWNLAVKLLLDARLDGLFYWLSISGTGEHKPHYGRFTIFDRPGKVQYTWMAPHTRGLESLVTVTFRKQGADTLLTLRHENLPDDEGGRGHEAGWGILVGRVAAHFAQGR